VGRIVDDDQTGEIEGDSIFQREGKIVELGA